MRRWVLGEPLSVWPRSPSRSPCAGRRPSAGAVPSRQRRPSSNGSLTPQTEIRRQALLDDPVASHPLELARSEPNGVRARSEPKGFPPGSLGISPRADGGRRIAAERPCWDRASAVLDPSVSPASRDEPNDVDRLLAEVPEAVRNHR